MVYTTGQERQMKDSNILSTNYGKTLAAENYCNLETKVPLLYIYFYYLNPFYFI